ncbi:carboxypeptidase-like regulatory domain-containing protein [Bacteroides sp.]|uniref:carboxypeptidase-like regulatory domain-containing protein n=1 Tax=Bacteroides sp. TaxID=29523 RepID=UPI002634AAED|nr:carboxypeptidase-like regulatory domain-containing protein [Bacteroides sp.]
MIKQIIGLILVCILPNIAQAQILKIKGQIVDEANVPISSATIQCFDAKGTLQGGAVSNNKGNFTCTVNNKGEQYRLLITFVGFQKYEFSFRTNNSDINLGNIALTTKNNQLSDVIITANQTIRKDDKIMIFPSKEQIRHAYDGYSALAMMMISRLNVDIYNKTVTTRSGETLLCINGREVKTEEVTILNPKDIIRVDFYENHHPEYPLASSVIDYIVVKHDHGGAGNISINENLNQVNGMDMAHIRFYHKKSEFTLYANGNYNHYSPHRGEEITTNFRFPNETITNNTYSMPSPIHKNGINTMMSYLYQGVKDQFCISINLHNEHNSNKRNSQQKYSNKSENLLVKDLSHTDDISPAIQFYYKHSFEKGRMFRATLYGSYNKTTVERRYQAFADKEVMTDYISLNKDNFYKFNPTLFYVHPIQEHSLFADFKYNHKQTSNVYTEGNNKYNNKLTNGQGIITIGDNLRIKKIASLTLQLADRMVYINNGKTSSFQHYFSPSLFTNFNLPKNNTIRLMASLGVYDPEMRYYNSAEQRIDQYQILMGNPNLVTSTTFSTEISYNKATKWGNFSYFMSYNRDEKNIFEQVNYDSNKNVFIHTYQNGGTFTRFISNVEFQFKLIPNKLTWMISGEYDYYSENDWEKQTINELLGSTQITLMQKGFNASLSATTPIKQLYRGQFITHPFSLKIDAGYNYKQWHFGMNIRNPFFNAPMKVKYTTNDYSKVGRTYFPRIQDNVFAVSINYRFNFGQKHQFQSVPMDNTRDSGILKANSNN